MPEYSISQLGTLEECPLQCRLIYVDRIKRYEDAVEAPDGASEIHDYKTGSSLPDQAEREFAPDFGILGDQDIFVRISARLRLRWESSGGIVKIY